MPIWLQNDAPLMAADRGPDPAPIVPCHFAAMVLKGCSPFILASILIFMVGLAFVTRYSGMDTVMGLTMTHAGWAFPFFGTLLGWGLR